MCNGVNLNDQWHNVVKRSEWRRLRKRGLIIRSLLDGSYVVVDGYGWGVEFARFTSYECAELFVVHGFFHR
jgi:hypothetical protein